MGVTNSVYLSIGSNLGDRMLHLQFALDELKKISTITQASSVYETESVGFESNSLFLNACLHIETHLNPLELLNQTQYIEKLAGRKVNNTGHYQDRSLDIDLLFFNMETIESDRLTVPHPRFQERKFVLIPLLEIAPELLNPFSKSPIKGSLKFVQDSSQVYKYNSTLFI
jgi:2-amino-4-hydroxy-6-hydroxymethyldihydropteridine diphosphokinase